MQIGMIDNVQKLIVNCILLTVNQQHCRSGNLHFPCWNRRTVDKSSIIRSNAFYHELRTNSGHSFPLLRWIDRTGNTSWLWHIRPAMGAKRTLKINITSVHATYYRYMTSKSGSHLFIAAASCEPQNFRRWTAASFAFQFYPAPVRGDAFVYNFVVIYLVAGRSIHK